MVAEILHAPSPPLTFGGGTESAETSTRSLLKLNLFACPLLLFFKGTVDNLFSSSLSLKSALRESGCRIGREPTKMS